MNRAVYFLAALLLSITAAAQWPGYTNRPATAGGAGAGTVTGVSGTSPVVSDGDTTNPTLSLSTVPANLGGTGVANNAASTIAISGNFATTLTVTGATSVTLPTSGTLLSTATTSTQTAPALGGILWWSSTASLGNINNAVISSGLPICSGGTGAPVACTNLTDVAPATATNTLTFTNKRITARVVSVADATTITPTGDTADMSTQANTQATGTLTVAAPIGTPTDGQGLLLRIKSTNVQTYAWNAIYRAGTTALPTASTGGGKTDYIAFTYNAADSKWDYTGTSAGF